jgi:hypothetical protein
MLLVEANTYGWSTHNVEAINIAFLNPPLELIGYLLWRTNNGCTETSNSNVFRNCVLGPFLHSRR